MTTRSPAGLVRLPWATDCTSFQAIVFVSLGVLSVHLTPALSSCHPIWFFRFFLVKEMLLTHILDEK